MGCGTSKGTISSIHPPVQETNQTKCTVGCGRAVQDWSVEDVDAWYSSLPANLQQHRSLVLPDEGCMLMQWSHQYLICRGVPEADAIRLIVYRDRAVAAAAAAGAAAPTGAAALGHPVTLQDPGAACLVVATNTPVTVQPVCVMPISDAQPDKSDTGPGGTAPGGQLPTSGNRTQQQPAEVGRRPLVELLKAGLSVTRQVVEQIKDSLPFPGKEAANLVLAVLNAVDQAVANSDNLLRLEERALAFLDILDAYHPSLKQIDRYNGVVNKFVQLLEGACSYARSYTSRNCVIKFLTGSSDRDHYEELVAGLAALTDQVMMAVAADSHARLQGLQAGVQEAVAALKRSAQYSDHAARVSNAVDAAGGLTALMEDKDKLAAVLQEMDTGQRITIETVSAIVTAHLDRGLHSQINSIELQLFWKRQYPGASSVPWSTFWQDFPAGIAASRDGDDAKQLAARLTRLLSSNAARMAFQQAVELEDTSCVSVYELRNAFSGEADLADEVLRLLEGVAGSSGVTDMVASGAATEAFTWSPAAATGNATPQAKAITFNGTRLQLPQAEAGYMGREETAHEVLRLLASSSVAVVAGGGMGKSSLAIDVGWRLFSTGGLPAGALWVDLREARTSSEVEARFCAALGLTPDPVENVRRIAFVVRNAASSVVTHGSQPKATLLLVVDNAEDALAHEEGASEALRAVLMQVVGGRGGLVRLIVTSRVSLGQDFTQYFKEVRLGRLGMEAASRVVRSIVQDALVDQCTSVAAACGCVPLVLRLVSEALVSSRMAMKDMPDIAAREHGICGTGGPDGAAPSGASSSADQATADDSEAIVAAVALVLRSLTVPHQRALAQLAVFPSAFSEEDAAAVSGYSRQQAAATVAFLHRQGLIQNSGRRGGTPYIIHATVRQVASQLGQGLDASLQSGALVRYGRLVLRLLGEWAGMYGSKEYRLALKFARNRQADVGRLVELVSPPRTPPVAETSGATSAAEASTGQLANSGMGRDETLRADAAGTAATADALWRDTAAAFTHELYLLLDALGLLTGLQRACEALLTRMSSSAPAPPGPEPSVSAESVLLRSHVLYFLAHIKCNLGLYAEAEAHANACIDARRQALMEDDPQMAAALYCLGWCVRCLGRDAEATESYTTSLEIRRRTLGEEHPDTAQSVHGMAICLGALGRLDEAEGMYNKAIEMRRKILGNDHPATANSLNGLASCMAANGDLSRAEELFKEILETRQRLQGEEHPDTAASLKNLALCIKHQGRHQEAEVLGRRALDLHVRVCGEEHPETAACAFNLGKCQEAQGRRAEAEIFYRRSLEVCRRLLGDAHPYTAAALEGLASCVEAQGPGRLGEAVRLWQDLAAMQRRVLGEAHELTAEAETRLQAGMAKLEGAADKLLGAN